MDSLEELLHDKLASLGATEISVWARRPMKLEFVEKFETIVGRKIPTELETFLCNRRIVKVQWNLVNNSSESVLVGLGNSDLYDLRTQMEMELDDLIKSNPQLENLLSTGAIVLDHLGLGTYVLLTFNQDGPWKLMLLLREGLLPIDITLESYLAYHHQTKGLFPWQLMFVEESVPGLELGYEFYEILAILAEGEPILQVPQFKRLPAEGSLAQMAKTMGYYDNVTQYLAQMGKEGFDYQDVSVQHSLGQAYTARVEHDLGMRLPDELRTWFYLYGEVKVQWRKGDAVAASKILPIDEVFGGNPDNYAMERPLMPYHKGASDYYGDPDSEALLQDCYPFMIDENGDIVMRIANGKLELYLLDSDVTTKKRLHLTLPEFITYLCKSRGMATWHTFLVDPKDSETAELREMVEEAFPGTRW